MNRSTTHCLLLILLLVSLPVTLLAQKPIALGITAGINISTQDFELGSDTNRTTLKGLILTGQTDWPLYGPAVLQDRLSYIEKGVVATRNSILTGAEKIRTELNYIELSLAPKVRFGMHDLKPYLFLGPRVGLLVSGNQVTERSSGSTTSVPVRENYRPLDFGLDIGGGFSYLILPRIYFLADVGFSYGLTNILKNPVAGTDEAFSRDLKIQAGFIIEAFDIDGFTR